MRFFLLFVWSYEGLKCWHCQPFLVDVTQPWGYSFSSTLRINATDLWCLKKLIKFWGSGRYYCVALGLRTSYAFWNDCGLFSNIYTFLEMSRITEKSLMLHQFQWVLYYTWYSVKHKAGGLVEKKCWTCVQQAQRVDKAAGLLSNWFRGWASQRSLVMIKNA